MTIFPSPAEVEIFSAEVLEPDLIWMQDIWKRDRNGSKRQLSSHARPLKTPRLGGCIAQR